MASTIMLPSALMGIGFPILESKVLPATPLSFILGPSEALGGRPKAFGLCLGIMSAAGFWVTMYGFSVGGARKKCKEMAAKNGEKDVEDRYSYPNLYVDGNTKPARAFNCKQRSHQHILETMPQFFLTNILVATVYPVTASAAALLWLLGRKVWCDGYSNDAGEPGKRYDHPLSKGIWVSYMGSFLATGLCMLKIFGISLF